MARATDNNMDSGAEIVRAFFKNRHIRGILEHADIDVDRVNKNLATPLYIAVFTRRTAAALALLRGGADPNLKNSKDLAPLHVARDARDAELVATLIVRGADASEVFTPLVAACTRGYAHAAREVVLTSDVDEEEIPALHRAILQGSDVAAAITPSDGPSPASCTDVTNQAALFYAIELGETGYLAPLLGAGSEKLLAAARAAVESGDDEPDEAAAAAEADAAAARPAASAADAAACGYVSGSRYCHFAHALVVSGLTETSDLAASLVSKYLGTAAACVYFDRAPAAFDALKAACVARLSRIAEPLEALYTAEDLGQRLGRIGEAYFNHEVRLDDAGLMPTPRKFRSHTTPEMVSYEAYIMYVERRCCRCCCCRCCCCCCRCCCCCCCRRRCCCCCHTFRCSYHSRCYYHHRCHSYYYHYSSSTTTTTPHSLASPRLPGTSSGSSP